MGTKQTSRWVSVLATLVLFGGLSLLALLATGRHDDVANAAADGASPSILPTVTAVARRTEQFHLAHAQLAANDDDESSLGSTVNLPLVTPEQAVAAVQRADPAGNNRPVWVSLETDASGQPVYVVRIDGASGPPWRVDARTGRILPPLGG